jgi:glycosyltransferase involved in cell wall biosynthesis
LEAFSQVLRVIPNALLVFAGDGAEMGFLKKQVKTLGITSKVHFLGHRTDIPQLLHFLDVYVQPSLKETFSLAVCEAMMTGRPIVASAVEGLPDLIVHMQTGLLVAPGNSSTLASAIIKLLQNKSIAVALGSQARAFTLERFTDESMSGQFLDLYESILMKKRQRKSCR